MTDVQEQAAGAPAAVPVAVAPGRPDAVPQQVRRREPTITVETAVDEATARRFYALYVETFRGLAVKAVARQLLHEHEFMEEMLDHRVDKLVARDEDGEPVAMCTLTRHLETVPWIEPAYFAHHYPEHTARDAVFYLGFILVNQAHRRAHLFIDLIARVTDMVIAREGMCAYDACAFNRDVLGLPAAVETLINGMATFDVSVIDSQTYYRALYVGPTKMPEMRNSSTT